MRALKTLRLSSCNLTYECDFVLETAFLRNPYCPIRELILAENPHGKEGLACLLRMLARPTCSLTKCDVDGIRSSELPPHIQLFDFVDPGGNYTLDLKNPYSRAVCFALVARHD